MSKNTIKNGLLMCPKCKNITFTVFLSEFGHKFQCLKCSKLFKIEEKIIRIIKDI